MDINPWRTSSSSAIRKRSFGGFRNRPAGKLAISCAGKEPDDWKPMPSVGASVRELRIWDASGTFRVIYVAKLADRVVVLHAFKKKTQATSRTDLELARTRYRRVVA